MFGKRGQCLLRTVFLLGDHEHDVRPWVVGVRPHARGGDQLPAGARRRDVSLDVSLNSGRALGRSEVPVLCLLVRPEAVGRDRLDHVATDDCLQAVALHVANAHAAILHTHIAGHAHVDERVDAAFRAEVEQLTAVVAVGNQVSLGDPQIRMLPTPVAERFLPARLIRAALAAVGRIRIARRIEGDPLGHGMRRDRLHRLALRVILVEVHYVRRGEDDLDSQLAGGAERLVHPRHEIADPRRVRLAPVPIPHVDDHDGRLGRLDLHDVLNRHAGVVAALDDQLERRFAALRLPSKDRSTERRQ